MSFPNISAERRTDKMFRNRDQPQHHKNEKSLFEELPIDMISSFPTSDPLHLLELGIMKKCFVRWVFGAKEYVGKWGKFLIAKVSRMLIRINSEMPSEFHRSVRILGTLKFWKGTEYRTMLLYAGIVVLKEALNEHEYLHFLTLSCAARIYNCKVYKRFHSIAADMIESYVENYVQLYVRDSIGSNVHNLIHIKEDMQQLNVESLLDISTYPYENALRMVKMQLKSNKWPLSQISRRLIEASHIEEPYEFNKRPFVPYVEYGFNYADFRAYKNITISPGVTLSIKRNSDSWFLTKSINIVKTKYIVKIGNDFKICGNEIIDKTDFFTEPMKTSVA